MFTITSEPVLQQIENCGWASIKYSVDGFWSSNIINVYISQRFGSGEWSIYESHSSGGKDDEFNGAEWERTRNFASAMMDAVDKMQFWSNNIEQLEEAQAKYEAEYKIREEQRRREREAIRLELEEAERVDRIINPSMGLKAATELAAELKDEVSFGTGSFTSRKLKHRSNGTRVTATAENLSGKTRFYLNRVAMSKAHFIEQLAEDYVLLVAEKEAA